MAEEDKASNRATETGSPTVDQYAAGRRAKRRPRRLSQRAVRPTRPTSPVRSRRSARLSHLERAGHDRRGTVGDAVPLPTVEHALPRPGDEAGEGDRGTDGQAVRHTALGDGDLDQRRLTLVDLDDVGGHQRLTAHGLPPCDRVATSL
jgi:hypothetical protein